MQEYLDTANDQIQVDKHQLNSDVLKEEGGKFYFDFIVIMFVLVQLKSVPE